VFCFFWKLFRLTWALYFFLSFCLPSLSILDLFIYLYTKSNISPPIFSFLFLTKICVLWSDKRIIFRTNIYLLVLYGSNCSIIYFVSIYSSYIIIDFFYTLIVSDIFERHWEQDACLIQTCDWHNTKRCQNLKKIRNYD